MMAYNDLMIIYISVHNYNKDCHITPPPPPQHKRAPKTSDISKEYPDYPNGNLHMKKSRCKTKTTTRHPALFIRDSSATELKNAQQLLQNQSNRTKELINVASDHITHYITLKNIQEKEPAASPACVHW